MKNSSKNTKSVRDGERIPVKFVLITMYELEGEKPGEFQYFREAEELRKTHDLPAGAFDIWTNDKGLLGLIVGIGAAKSSASTMALGLDPRFDLSRAYFMIAGICGVNPRVCSLASVVWADYCVDGDLAHEIDPRETPEDWETGVFPLGSFAPFSPGKRGPKTLFLPDEVYHLNQGLSTWACNLTRRIDLTDLENPEMARYRKRYQGFPEAQRPPFYLKGDNLGMTRYWHGKKTTEWAEKWVAFWTEGKGRFATSTMEDNGTLRALTQLAKAGIIDWNRVMLLRTGSNYTMQAPDGQSALESFRAEGEGGGGETMFPGYLPSLRSLQRAGSAVIREIIDHWDRYAGAPPKG
jgi:purine nucleoside permease